MTAGREPSQQADEDPERRLRPDPPPAPSDEVEADDPDLTGDGPVL